MTSNPADWFSCPNCGFNNFSEDEVQSVNITCPECGLETDGLKESPFTDTEEIRDMLSVSQDRGFVSEDQPKADDAEEVVGDTLNFIEDEEYYKAGGEDFECPECGSLCDMSCGAFGMSDVAFCKLCQYQFTRQRQELVDDIRDGMIIEVSKEDREVYQEYECVYCGEKHPYTKPDGKYKRSQGEVNSLEEVAISCPCGDRIVFNGAKPNEKYPCECGRSYELQMNDLN